MVWTTTEWASGSYAPGDTVYYATTGHCYTCILAATTQNPANATYWRVEPFPMVFAEAVKAGAYAATLGEEGQHSTAALAGAAMEEMLFRETEALERQNQQTRGFNVGVRVPP
jgi:hypothetical protein